MSLFEDTICAASTASGGAISVIRVSGEDALKIVDRIFLPVVRRKSVCCSKPGGECNSPHIPFNGQESHFLSESKGYTIHFGTVFKSLPSCGSGVCEGGDEFGYSPADTAESTVSSDSSNKGKPSSCIRTIDEAMVSVFHAPYSYTGENSAEISCHGSSFIVQEILSLLVENGARMATPGEFTQRAFVNGKMDLSQAEAVADLIASQTSAAHRVAINQLKGGFSNELALMREELLKIVSLMELELDFSEEEVEFADRNELRILLEKVISHVSDLISSFSLGNAIKNGVPVAIVGATNAGKSTLLNAIIGENRAIVSDIAGTTRDTIEETYNIDGILFRFIDTAGLRSSDDVIERIGIDRAYDKLASASLVLAVIDLTSPLEEISCIAQDILSKVSDNQKVIFLLNKSDIVPDSTVRLVTEHLSSIDQRSRMTESPLLSTGSSSACSVSGTSIHPCFTISAKEKSGIKEFIEYISDEYKHLESASETSLVTNLRHLEALKSAREALTRVREGLDTATPTDLIAQDIREALHYLGTITGTITTDEILGNIFSKFCVGK